MLSGVQVGARLGLLAWWGCWRTCTCPSPLPAVYFALVSGAAPPCLCSALLLLRGMHCRCEGACYHPWQVISVNLKMALTTRYWTWLNHLTTWASIVLFVPFLWLYGLVRH